MRKTMPQGLQSPLRCGGLGGDWQQRQGPALPEARVPKTRGGSQGDGDGSQPGQAAVSCRFRGAFRRLLDRFPFRVGGDGQTAHKGAHSPEPSLEHDAEALERPIRARPAPVARHTEPKRDNMGDTPMAEESEAPGTVGCAGSGGKHVGCHCEHLSFLIGKYRTMGMDAIVQHLHCLDNQKDGLEEDIAGILDDQSEAERDMAELGGEQDRYPEKLEMALQKQQRVVDSLLHLVEDMSGRLKRLEELQPLASDPELLARLATAELLKQVRTLRSTMEKPMGGPAEAPYAPPRVDPGAPPFVPMFSESIMLGEHTAPAGSMRRRARNQGPEEPDGTDVPCRPGSTDRYDCPCSLSRRGDPDHAGANHRKGRRTWSRPSRRKPVGEPPHYKDMGSRWSTSFPHPKPHGFRPNWNAFHGGEGCMGSVLTPPATGGIRLGGVVAADVGDAIRIDDLRGTKIPYYDGNPSNLDDFILDWDDFAEEVVGEMKGAPRDKWVCRTFPHRLAQDLKEELRDQIREGLIQTEQACLQWLEDEVRVDAPNQKLEDLWSIALPLERGELRVREWNWYIGWRTRRGREQRSPWLYGSWHRRTPTPE